MMHHPSEADVIERDRKQRLAMKYFSEEMYRRLKASHPRIVKHLQGLPNAQAVVLERSEEEQA